MTDYEQRRAAARLAKNFMVRYRSLDQAAWKVSTLKDFSRTGARLICEDAFNIGTSILLELGLPLFEKPVQITARVAWCKRALGGKLALAEHGIAFGALDPATSSRIDEAMTAFQKKQKPEDQKNQQKFEVEEDRNKQRVARRFIVRYRSSPKEPWRITSLKNFSATGARFICEEAFDKGSFLQISLGPPLFEQAIEVVTKVVWCKKAFQGKMGLAEHGVEFTSMGAFEKKQIEQAVKRFLLEIR